MTTASTNPEGTSSTIASEMPASSQTSQETTNNTQQNQNTQSGQQTQNPQSNQTNTADDTISVETAKEKALTHAGVSDVTYTKAKMDRDDGQVVYEIEFRKDGMEYDYTIRATDGFILEYDSEWDD